MRRLYIGVLAALRIDAATIDAVRRTTNVTVYGAGNASHAQHYAATFASLRCGGHADRFLFLDGPAPASAVALAAIGVRVERGVTMHGFAINCDNSLAPFQGIIPCGITDAGVTTVSEASGVVTSPRDIVATVIRHLTSTYAEVAA